MNLIKIGWFDLQILKFHFQPEVDFLNQKLTLKYTKSIHFFNQAVILIKKTTF